MNTIAGGACLEARPLDGPACPDEQCDFYGCRCDGWVQVVISETGEMTEEELVNQSTGHCAGSRWVF